MLYTFQISSFPAHPMNASTAKLWTNGTDEELRSYFSYKQFLICPRCQLILADFNELKNHHRNAPGFLIRKKDLFDQRKYISVLLHTWCIGFSSTLNPNFTFIFLKNFILQLSKLIRSQWQPGPRCSSTHTYIFDWMVRLYFIHILEQYIYYVPMFSFSNSSAATPELSRHKPVDNHDWWWWRWHTTSIRSISW